MGEPQPSKPGGAPRSERARAEPAGEGAESARWSIGVFLFALAVRALTLLESWTKRQLGTSGRARGSALGSSMRLTMP